MAGGVYIYSEVGEYKEDPGTTDCDDCPDDSTTAGTGSTVVTACECDAGYSGIIADDTDTCQICTYSGEHYW